MGQNVITAACFELTCFTRQRFATSLHMEQNVQILESKRFHKSGNECVWKMLVKRLLKMHRICITDLITIQGFHE